MGGRGAGVPGRAPPRTTRAPISCDPMVVDGEIRLTSFSHGAGCACKLSPADLRTVLSLVRGFDRGAPSDPNLLVGFDKSDDAAVYRLRDDLAVVVTTDFFTPIVDDPYDWGRIEATNALSDVYAMGGTPLLALNLVAWPREGLPFELLARVLDGGAATCADAGCLVAGGHSIDDAEPKFGLAVVGTVHPDAVLTNAGANAGDAARAHETDRPRRDLDGSEARRCTRGARGRRDRGDDHAEREHAAMPRSRSACTRPPTSRDSACSVTCVSCARRRAWVPRSMPPPCP